MLALVAGTVGVGSPLVVTGGGGALAARASVALPVTLVPALAPVVVLTRALSVVPLLKTEWIKAN